MLTVLEGVVSSHPFGVLTRHQSESQIVFLGGQAIVPSPVLDFLVGLDRRRVEQQQQQAEECCVKNMAPRSSFAARLRVGVSMTLCIGGRKVRHSLPQ